MCRLATGHAKGSPFPPDLIKAGRDLVFNELRIAGSRAHLEVLPERQPFYLEAISELLRLAGDPDWRRYTKATWSFASGVPLGVDVALGAMVEMTLEGARAEFGGALSVASLGAIPKRGGKLLLNAVGTFGIVSASYWWHRLFSGLGRLLYYAHPFLR
eukprot:s6185_g3.t1